MINYKKALTENNRDFKRVLESLIVRGILIADKKHQVKITMKK